MNTETIIYIFNENGIVEESKMENFSKRLIKNSSFDFRVFEKKDIDMVSTIYKKFSSANIELILYDYGYVMKIEGDIKEALTLLKQLDNTIDRDVIYFVSPSQRVVNSEETKFPRGADEREIANFLDRQFNNNEYTSAHDRVSF